MTDCLDAHRPPVDRAHGKGICAPSGTREQEGWAGYRIPGERAPLLVDRD